MNDIHKVKRAWENYKATGEVRILSEGTWSAPQTVEQAQELAQLMAIPLPVSTAADKLYNLMGDDNLFDTFYKVEEKGGPDEDVRGEVTDKLHHWLFNIEEDDWRNPWDEEAVRILWKVLKDFAKEL